MSEPLSAAGGSSWRCKRGSETRRIAETMAWSEGKVVVGSTFIYIVSYLYK